MTSAPPKPRADQQAATLGCPLQDHPHTRPAIQFAKHDRPSVGCGHLRALRRISGPGPGLAALWLTACAAPSVEVTASPAPLGGVGQGLGWH